MKKFKTGGVVPGPMPISMLPGERLRCKNVSGKCKCDICNKKEDHVVLKSGRSLYAYGRVLGLPLDGDGGTIYSGHDGYVGEFDGGLTDEEKKEIYEMMIKRLTGLLEGLS